MGGQGDAVVLTGKGHEKYQDIRGVKYPWDDVELARKVLQNMDRKALKEY